MDDITPDMDWPRFRAYIDLFGRHGVRPLLGVVPDNRDPKLTRGPRNPAFWDELRSLRDAGRADFAQHGYQHLYVSRRHGLLGRRYGFKPQSEFVGLDYGTQLAKIRAGHDILRREGIDTDIFMAPSNSFDRTTLRALRDSGFRAVTDGIALFPFERDGLVFVPQQIWRPLRAPFGVWTICLHSNEPDDALFREVESHLASGTRVVSFGEARQVRAGSIGRMMEGAFRALHDERRAAALAGTIES
jgi:predicted deacetylase